MVISPGAFNAHFPCKHTRIMENFVNLQFHISSPSSSAEESLLWLAVTTRSMERIKMNLKLQQQLKVSFCLVACLGLRLSSRQLSRNKKKSIRLPSSKTNILEKEAYVPHLQHRFLCVHMSREFISSGEVYDTAYI